jgi:radical SAM superfamily enzyme YgiQ (UPF0313 family)
MNEKVLFVCSSNGSQVVKGVNKDSKLGMEHLGLLYLQSLLTEKGITTKNYDFNFEGYHGKGRTLDEQINLILQENPSVVGFSPYFTSIENTLQIAEMIKRSLSETKIIFGGLHASHTATELLEDNQFIDAIFLGESFGTIEKIVNEGLRAENIGNIQGLAYRKDGKVINNGFGKLVDLNSLSSPYRSKEFYNKTKTASIMFSQGCIGKCTFCPTGSSNSRARIRSIESVVGEIEGLVEKFGIDTIEAHSDDSFGLAEDALDYYSSFAKELIDRDFNINWRAVLRASDFGNGRLSNEDFW